MPCLRLVSIVASFDIETSRTISPRGGEVVVELC